MMAWGDKSPYSHPPRGIRRHATDECAGSVELTMGLKPCAPMFGGSSDKESLAVIVADFIDMCISLPGC